MNKLHFIAIVALSILTGCKSNEKAEKKTATKPNVIVIYTDDLGYGDI